MTDRNRLQNYYGRDRSYSRDRLQKYYDKNKSCRRDRSPRYYKNNYEREYYHIFQDHEIGENIKRVIKTSIEKKIINIREGLKIIMKMSMRTGMLGMNININTEMKVINQVEIELEKNSMNAMQGKPLTFQNLN